MANVYSPFEKWNADKQNKCITACGLSYRPYRNKPLRNGVLAKLAQFEIPLDIEAVKAQLTRDHIEFNSRYPTQIVKTLLDHLSGVVRPTNDTVRQVPGPSIEDTSKNARACVEKLMFEATDEFTTPALEKLWQPRRQVLNRMFFF